MALHCSLADGQCCGDLTIGSSLYQQRGDFPLPLCQSDGSFKQKFFPKRRKLFPETRADLPNLDCSFPVYPIGDFMKKFSKGWFKFSGNQPQAVRSKKFYCPHQGFTHPIGIAHVSITACPEKL